MNKNIALLLVSMITALLLGCHGGEEDSGVTSVSPSSITSASCGALTQQIGAGVGQSFVAGSLTVGLSPLSAGGSTSVTVNIVDCANNPYTPPVAISFSSTCTGLGTAQIDSPIITNNGTAITTYVAQGCQGNDTIIATAVIDSTDTEASDLNLIAAGVVNVLPAAAGSIEFVSATPELISLKGTGGAGLTENSTVVFKVSDVSGGPVSNRAVTFTLSTTIGGLSLSSSTGTTNANGQVQTVVQAGTVPTAVRVTATVDSTTPAIATQSDQLVVSTGIPDQNSFSLSTETYTPEAWDYDGETVAITARLADRFNNPVPDGTVVYFTTEGGSIGSSCATVDGACSVDWVSQAPKPCGEEIGEASIDGADENVLLNNCNYSGPLNPAWFNPLAPPSPAYLQPGIFAPLGQPYGGRVTIIAAAVGEESFIDNNTNGIFDNGDIHEDLDGEAYLDINEDRDRDLNQDIFFDFDGDGSYDGSGDGLFNGVLCQHTTLCSTQQTLHVRASLVLTMSGSSAYIDIVPSIISVPNTNTITIANGGSASATVTLADLHHQRLPAGSTVSVATSYGTLLTSGSFVLPDSSDNGVPSYGITIKGTAPTEQKSGLLTVTLTTPKGLISRATADVIEEGPPSADLAIVSMADAPDPISQAAPTPAVTYTITVRNYGPDDATNVALTNTLPTGTFVSGNTGCTLVAPTVCNIGNMVAGAPPTVITLTLNVAGVSGAPTNINMTSAIAGDQDDPSSGNNGLFASTTVNP